MLREVLPAVTSLKHAAVWRKDPVCTQEAVLLHISAGVSRILHVAVIWHVGMPLIIFGQSWEPRALPGQQKMHRLFLCSFTFPGIWLKQNVLTPVTTRMLKLRRTSILPRVLFTARTLSSFLLVQKCDAGIFGLR